MITADDNGTLEKFHLGLSADGQSCLMIFLDEERRTIRYTADFAQFSAFIASLNRAAAQRSARKRSPCRAARWLIHRRATC